MAEITLLKAVALGGAWLCVVASLMSKIVTGVGYGLAIFVAISMTFFLI